MIQSDPPITRSTIGCAATNMSINALEQNILFERRR